MYIASAVLLVLAGTWYVGRFDGMLPNAVKAKTVLGSWFPGAKPSDTNGSGSGATTGSGAAMGSAAAGAATPSTTPK